MDKKNLIISNAFSGFAFLMIVFFVIGIIAHNRLMNESNDIAMEQAYNACRYIDLVLCIVIAIGCFVPNILMLLKSNKINKGRMFIKVMTSLNICFCILAFLVIWAGTFYEFWITLGCIGMLLIVFALSISMTVKMQKTHQMISSV